MLAESQSPLLQQLRLHWTCPLSNQPIEDPVLTTIGNTYDRMSLLQWFNTNAVDPVSKIKLIYPHPVPNIALQSIIRLLETELPKVHNELTENRIIIKDLSQKIATIKEIIGQKKLDDEESEDLLFDTNENIKKTKRIKKDTSSSREHENSKLKQALAQNQKYRQLINDLREKEISYKEQIQLQEKQIQQIKAQLDNVYQTSAINQNDLSLYKEWSKEQDKALNKLQSFTKDYFEMAYTYNDEFIKQILKHHKSVLNGTLNLKRDDLIEFADTTLKNNLWASMEVYRANPKKNPEVTECFQRCEKIIQFAQIQTFMRKNAKQNILSWTTIPDDRHCAVYSSLSLKMIPFSCPATIQELKVDWKQVIEIHSEANTPVRQQQWNQLMANIEKFPQLIHLTIDDCKFSKITAEDLSKLKKMEKIYLNQGHFKDCEQILQDFQSKHSWIDMKWTYTQ